jgi:hypothetical protein
LWLLNLHLCQHLVKIVIHFLNLFNVRSRMFLIRVKNLFVSLLLLHHLHME